MEATALQCSQPDLNQSREKRENEASLYEEEREGNGFFDPGAPPPFSIAEIRAAIPKKCWVKNPWISIGYVARDIIIIFSLAAIAAYFNSWNFWPIYWAAQGTMFWAVFVLGHDCGHGSFSDNSTLNSVVGHLLHTCILVPYHGWRISHKIHHQNHGHVENDESWHPVSLSLSCTHSSIVTNSKSCNQSHCLSEKIYKNMDPISKKMRFTVPFPLFVYPIYLWRRSPGRKGSHFNPYSNLFGPKDRKGVIISTICWFTMAALLLRLTQIMGSKQIINLYFVPYMIFIIWLDLVTYLHHHGHKQRLPWYRGKEWSYLRGALTTVDRDYGMINGVHHNIGTHVIHHLFPQIPHYNLVEATEAAKLVLGKYYREPEKSKLLPVHLVPNILTSMKEDHFVSDEGEVVYYQKDHDFSL